MGDGRALFCRGCGDAILAQAQIFTRLLHEASFISTVEVDRLSPEEVDRFHQYATVMSGSSAKPRAQKLRALRWEPVGLRRERTLEVEIEGYIAASQVLPV